MNTLPEAFLENGVRLSLLLLGWGALACLVVGGILLAWGIMRDMDGPFFTGLCIIICGVIATGIWLVDMFPYDGKYQHYYSVEGTVEKVSNVLAEADGTLTRQPVIELDNVERPLVVDDPRAVTLEKEDVTLRCVIEWHYKAADTYQCKIVQY